VYVADPGVNEVEVAEAIIPDEFRPLSGRVRPLHWQRQTHWPDVVRQPYVKRVDGVIAIGGQDVLDFQSWPCFAKTEGADFPLSVVPVHHGGINRWTVSRLRGSLTAAFQGPHRRSVALSRYPKLSHCRVGLLAAKLTGPGAELPAQRAAGVE
jgi:hypothetical protein